MRLTWLLVLAACAEPAPSTPGTNEALPTAPQPRAIPRPDARAAGSAAPTHAWPVGPKPPPPPPRPIALSRGAHGGAIVSVALSEDGTAAFTVDSGHRARLWPALDGTREPLVIPIQTPLTTAVERVGTDLVIGVLDTAGGIAVLRVDDHDQLVGRTTITAEPPFQDLVAIAQGFIAMRADQVIEVIDAQGKRRGRLSPEPGHRVVGLVYRRERTLALLASRDGLHGRWIELASGAPSWGEVTPALDIDPTTAVLSPDHQHLAATQQKSRRAAIVDLATGKSTPLRSQGGALVPLGFIADDRVAVARVEFDFSMIEWWDVTGKVRGSFGQNFELDFVSVKPAVAGDNQVVAFFEQQLVMLSPSGLRYLGYAIYSPSRLRGSVLGMATELGGVSTLLDSTLRIDRRVPAPSGGLDSAMIDDRHAVMLVGPVDTTLDDEWIDPALVHTLKRGRWIELVDLQDPQAKKHRQKLSFNIRETRLHYEATTRLLAVNGGAKVTFARFDPAAGQFAAPITVPLAAAVRDLALLDPALAGGDVALVVHAQRNAITARRFGDDLQPRAPVTLPGTFETIDRAGHVYMRDTPDVVIAYAGDRPLGRIEALRGWKLRPSLDGTRVAAFGQGRILLANLDGTTRWAIGFPGVTDLQWSASGELIAVAGGLARVDAASGNVLSAQCGWKFGLRSSPSNAERAASVCDR